MARTKEQKRISNAREKAKRERDRSGIERLERARARLLKYRWVPSNMDRMWGNGR